jgi:hypothetical protein
VVRWLVAFALVACSSLDPPKPQLGPPGEPTSEDAATAFLHAAAGGSLERLRHVVPDADACKQLDNFPECSELGPSLTHRIAHIQLVVAPYANAKLEKAEQEGPLPGSEMWLARMPGRPALVIITFKAGTRYFALAKVGL